MKSLILIFLFPISVVAAENHVATAKTSTGGHTQWESADTWVDGVVPNNSDSTAWEVHIPEGAMIALLGDIVVDRLVLVGDLSVDGMLRVKESTQIENGLLTGVGTTHLNGLLNATGLLGSWHGNIYINGEARFDNVNMLFERSIFPAPEDHIEITNSGTLEVLGGLNPSDRTVGFEIDGGFINNGVIRFVGNGASSIQIEENVGTIEIVDHKTTVVSSNDLSGSYTTNPNGRLIFSLPKLVDADILGQGTIASVGNLTIYGGMLRVNQVEVSSSNGIILENIFNTLVNHASGNGGSLRLKNSALYVTEGVRFSSGQLSLENSLLQAPEVALGSGAGLDGYGTLNGNVIVENGQVYVNEGYPLQVNGNIELMGGFEPEDEPVLVGNVTNVGTGNPPLTVDGTLTLNGKISLEEGLWVDVTKLENFKLVSASEFISDLSADSSITLGDDLIAKMTYGVDSPYGENTLAVYGFLHLNPWLIHGFKTPTELDSTLLLPESDPDNDGYSNQEEFLYGSWPMDPRDTPNLQLQLYVSHVSGDLLENQFVWFRAMPNSAHYDVTYSILISEDLVNWVEPNYFAFEGFETHERDYILETYYQQFRFEVHWQEFYARLNYNLTGPNTYPELP